MKTTLPPAPRSVTLIADIVLAKTTVNQMAAICEYRQHVQRMNLLGGHHNPLVMHVKGEVENRGHKWTDKKYATALLAGAI